MADKKHPEKLSGTHAKTAKKDSMMSKAKKKAAAMEAARSKDKTDGRKRGSPIARYFKDMRSELKKVVWPSRKKIINNTGIVLLVMIAYGALILGIDSGLAALFNILLT